MPTEGKSESTNLGLVSLPAGTFEHDLAVGNGYQNFSGELLRLSLAGIGAIGFLIVNMFRGENGSMRPELLMTQTIFGPGVFLSLLLFGFAASFALAHRYIGTESKAYHLKYLRLICSGQREDESTAEEARRDLLFLWSGRLLILASVFVSLAAMILAVSFYPVLFKFHNF